VSGAAAESGREEDAVVAAVTAGDQAAFATLAERHRRELQVHCYRMLGSLDDAEDLVQETFLRAWRKRQSFEGRSSFRAWLYRIATNACLDALEGKARRVLPQDVVPAEPDPLAPVPPSADLPWLQPYPDRLLQGAAPSETEPDALVVDRETIELAFLAAIQHLPPRQRATMILRDVLGWSARETAAVLDASVASANSALQRARATLKERLPARRLEWRTSEEPTEEEQALLQRYMAAHERGDADAVADLLREDVRLSMPPVPLWYEGREAVRQMMRPALDPASSDYVGDFLLVPTAANGQPAAANYVRAPGRSEYRALALDVIRIEDGVIAEIVAFPADVFPRFGFPPVWVRA
jgi:RNA polymerase sigma-70 factor, ECF subfamily